MTVSRALSGKTNIQPETAERIRKIANELGYEADPEFAAAITRIRRSSGGTFHGTIGILASIKEPHRRDEPHKTILATLDSVARDHGYSTDLFGMSSEVEDTTTPERFRTVVETRGLRGIIQYQPFSGSPFYYPDRIRVESDLFHLPRAVIGREFSHREPVYYITPNHMENAHVCFRVLRGKGFRRIGLQTHGLSPGRETPSATQHFLAGYRLAQEIVPPEERLPPCSLYSSKTPEALIAAWIDQQRPDVVICNFWPDKLLKVLEERGETRIGVVTWDRNESRKHDLAGMSSDYARMARLAMEAVLAQIHREHLGLPATAQTISIPGHWVDGTSLPPRPKTPPANRERFLPVDLARWVNQPCTKPGGWLGMHLLFGLHAEQTSKGVPLRVASTPGENFSPLSILVRSKPLPQTASGEPALTAFRIPLGRKLAAVHLLHGCARADFDQLIGSYQLVYETGEAHKVPVQALGGAVEPTLYQPKERMDVANIQDWWPMFPVLQNDTTAPLIVTVPESAIYHRFLYHFRLRNPQPDAVVQALQFEVDPGNASPYALLSVTLETPPVES